MSALPQHRMTIEEYIEFDKNAEGRYEYFDGEVFAMAGGSPEHSRISINVTSRLFLRLLGSSCEIFNADMQLKVPAAPPYRYPDASVICGGAIFEEVQGIKLLVNPLLLIEVLSPTTEGYDLGKKFTEYKSIASFQEYLAISQSRPHVIRYFRHPNGFWVRHDIEGLENEVLLESLNIVLPLSEIYERVNFREKE
ncbi:MAG: Uma2 family endonuclease [Blastocatellia bacterium]|nr:Uma2 family endonuclease [Blastocatellia bacterium]